jgi:hypothetical protein
MVKQGRYDEAIERASTRKFEPRGRSARAYARALVERERYHEARAVLYRDFRHGQQFESLDALASLELRHGARGMAALHFSKLMELDAPRLRGRTEVCQLFRERAQANLSQGEAIAADQDLRRTYELCRPPEDAALARADRELASRIAPAASERARGLRVLPRHSVRAVSQAEASATLAAKIAERRAMGAAQLSKWALDQGVSLPAEDLVFVLRTEFDDLARGELFSLSELARMLGNTRVEEVLNVAATSDEGDPAVLAYAQLRLAPIAELRGERGALAGFEKASLAALAAPAELPRERLVARSWKVMALTGQLDGAELVLTSWLKSAAPIPAPVPSPEPSSGEDPSPTQAAPLIPWWERLVDSEQTLGPLMVTGHLLEARGETLRALEIWAAAGRRAMSSADERVATRLATEGRRQLRLGRPWRALALAEFTGREARDALRAAAETQLALAMAWCGDELDACEMGQELQLVERVMGGTWVETRQRSLVARRPARAGVRDGCLPAAADLSGNAGHAPARLFRALTADVETQEAPELSRALADEIEAELSLGCGALMRVELLHRLLADLPIRALNEYLTQAPVERSSAALETKAALALAGGLHERAWELTRAAAGDSPDPVRIMERAARRGRVWGEREYELAARTRILELDATRRWGWQARAILRLRFADLEASKLLTRGYGVAVEAWQADFLRHVEAFVPARRDAEVRALVLEIWQDAPQEEGRRALWRGGLEALFGEERVSVALDLPADAEEGSLLGASVAGAEGRRAAALVSLVQASEEGGGHDRRARLVGVLLEGGSAVDEEGEATRLLPRDDLAWRLAFDLPIDVAEPHD